MATYQRGILTTDLNSSVYGLVQSVGKSGQCQIVTAEDENGNTFCAEQVNPTENVNLEFVYDTSKTLTSIRTVGTPGETPVTVTIGTDKYMVQSWNDQQSNSGFRRLSLSCTRYTKNGVPANGT
ncbi:conserved hypothetical protein [Gammaproteobacteria bacterium]